MLGRILLIGTTITTLSACAWLQPFESPEASQGYFATRSIADQDPYWRRFYELEQQIAQLKASNQQLQQQLAPQPAIYTAPAPANTVEIESSTLVDDVLAKVREQADRAIAAIDQAMASLATPAAPPLAQESLTAQVNIPAIQGNLIRNDEGEVVKQTTYSEARKHRYNFSVVYVYPEPQPWNAMWDKLEAAEEKDKWRGSNASRTRYFIYVGAYYNQMDAQQRQEALFALVGERPDMRERVQEHALAAN